MEYRDEPFDPAWVLEEPTTRRFELIAGDWDNYAGEPRLWLDEVFIVSGRGRTLYNWLRVKPQSEVEDEVMGRFFDRCRAERPWPHQGSLARVALELRHARQLMQLLGWILTPAECDLLDRIENYASAGHLSGSPARVA